MNIAAVITRLREGASIFSNRVAGAADFATGLESTVNMTLPAAFVIPLEDEAVGNDEASGLRQIISERIGVIVQIANDVTDMGDRRGQAPVEGVDAVRSAIFAAILNWRPSVPLLPAARGFEYAGGRLVDFDRARLFWQFDFILETTVTDSDGWQAPAEDLEEIDVYLTSPDGAVTIAGAAAADLQD